MKLDSKISEYDGIRAKLVGVVSEAMATADEPEVAASVILEAAQASQPKLRYTAGKTARLFKFLRRFAPASVLDKGIRKSLKLDTRG
ncbi:hypothetical protein AB8616_13420 [Marinomonas sp. RS-M-Aa-14]|uniref:hypothetical protein n=1 Tax=Marinomonas sp. RS-M-Aa-14 TaxID=3241169 RepID=UPI003AAB26F5